MTDAPGARSPARCLGRLRGEEPGPTLLVVAGIHGNEPAGVVGARRVVERLESSGARIRGEFVAFAGNVAALARDIRYVSHDLNRAWTAPRMAALREGRAPGATSEDREQAELHAAIEETLAAARGEVHFADLHSTSGEGAPFLVAADTTKSRGFAEQFPLTVILSLVERLQGTLVGALAPRVAAAIVLESGQHSQPVAAERSEALLWIALVRMGIVAAPDAPPLGPLAVLLAEGRGSLPVRMEVAYRHAICPDDEFRMRPGYRHFQRITAGEVVADDAHGPVAAPVDGYMLMPLYQGRGEDGFFLAR